MDRPWQAHSPNDALYYPELQEILLQVGRRTQFLIIVSPGDGDSDRAVENLIDGVLTLAKRHAVLGRLIVAGNARVLKALGSRHHRSCLVAPVGCALAEARAQCAEAGASVVIVSNPTAEEMAAAAPVGPAVIVGATGDQHAIDPALYTLTAGKRWIGGYLVQAVHEMHAQMYQRGLIVFDDFLGKMVDRRLWTLGLSRNNKDATIAVSDGLRIRMDGREYAGAAAISNFAVNGDFDARVSFEVENPQQGTTFELAAIHVDAGYRPVNLTFDVHGVPPYASSERDENDGFRIGWNNGPALTRWIDGEAQSSNLYNCYGRDVGYAKADNPSGRLRLTRRGDVFNAYYSDKFNDAWVLSGSVAVPALAPAVFLRLGAKHWPKRGNEPPTNTVRFSGFELYQWD